MHIPLISKLAPALLPFLHPAPPAAPTTSPAPTPAPLSSSSLTFTPIHAHAHSFTNTSRPALLLHNASSHPSAYLSTSSEDRLDAFLADEPLTIRTVPLTIRRPRVRPPQMISWALSAREKRRRSAGGRGGSIFPWSATSSSTSHANTTGADAWEAPDFDDEAGGWEDVEVLGPDVKDRQTLLTLAKMTSNAYVTPDSGQWWPTAGYNVTLPFGWEPDTDGLRGHIFADATNSTVIISIKGTSAGVLGSGGPTAKNDKFNDNLLFSCCCARVDFSWSPVCDCYAGGYKCEQTCLEDALVAESVYATVGTNLYNNVTYMYPNATIWLAGHSLGGSLSSMVGLSFGAPAVSFEAPGDLMPSRRLHLPLPPGMPVDMTGITHVYHTADPIPMGACTGAYSGCYAAGFALESKCHTGKTILYDTVTVKGWSVDIRTHSIVQIINKVLADPWPVADEPGDEPDKPKEPKDPKDPKDPEKPKDGSVQASWWGWGRKGPKKGKNGEDDGGDGDEQDDGGWEKHGGVPRAKAEDECVDCYRW
ncbi:Autophagy-related protein 15 [Saitozyma sp. JCM 24511]|nr:Autophagy-related protein 15 [Saitozyma sp. JCM 24511]